MAKKIKFALKMKDGIEVRTLKEFREAFALEQALAYFLDGKLLVWLEDRFYEEEAEKVSALENTDPELPRKLCDIFGVEYEEDTLSPEEIEYRNEKLKKLKEITEDDELLSKVDQVAFSQEELADLLSEGITTVYLCGDDFVIPTRKKDITFIGINTKLSFTSEQLKKYEENNIKLIDCYVLEDDIKTKILRILKIDMSDELNLDDFSTQIGRDNAIFLSKELIKELGLLDKYKYYPDNYKELAQKIVIKFTAPHFDEYAERYGLLKSTISNIMDNVDEEKMYDTIEQEFMKLEFLNGSLLQYAINYIYRSTDPVNETMIEDIKRSYFKKYEEPVKHMRVPRMPA